MFALQLLSLAQDILQSRVEYDVAVLGWAGIWVFDYLYGQVQLNADEKRSRAANHLGLVAAKCMRI